jgi:cytochrome P450
VLGGRLPEFGDLPRLVAVEQTFKESLRLYPPIYFFSREVAETVEVAATRCRR